MFKLDTGTKTVEHKTMTIQQRMAMWAIAGSFVAGFALNGWATATANAAEKVKAQPAAAVSTSPTTVTTTAGKAQ